MVAKIDIFSIKKVTLYKRGVKSNIFNVKSIRKLLGSLVQIVVTCFFAIANEG